jgi:TolB-like protein
MSIGTPAYMSPEQVLGETVDHRTDIYSFGVMAWELLAGHAPFRADDSARLVALHLSAEPRDIAEVRPDCPSPLARLVMQCLAKSVEDRPQAASELVRMLDSVTLERVTAVQDSRREETRPGRALALWSLATAGVSFVAWAATAALGLPDWVLPGAVGIMLLGAPVLLLTAYVQRPLGRPPGAEPPGSGSAASRPSGTLATAALKARPHLTWQRVWRGGAAALGAFTLVVLGYMIMRALGIGPVGTLQARGEFGARETLIVADFRGPVEDSELGPTVAEALRTDLGQSNMLTVLTRTALNELLVLMKRPDEKDIHFDLAREIATREGAKAVLDGQVMRVGQGYVLSARLVSAMDGAEHVPA